MVGALSDLKIVELGEMVSAPYCTKLFADLGADVVKIEPPRVGDPSRTRGPFPNDEVNPEKSGLFLYLNTNKRGVTLDVAGPDGFGIFEKLIADADVLVHNLAPPEMDRMGLNFDRLQRINPALIMTSIAPYGLSGPYRNYRSEDLTLWCAGGVCVLNGGGPEHRELPPLKTFGHQAGYQGGVHAATATIAAVVVPTVGEAAQHAEV